MTYVIQRDDDKFVAKRGNTHSYTDYLQDAQPWDSWVEADRNCCSNETARNVEDIMGSGQ